MTAYGYAVIAAVLLLAAGLVLWDRRRTRRIMENLNRMLELAMQGDFTEKQFDESLLSAVSQLAPKAEAKGVQIMQEAVQANAVFDPKWTEEAVYNLLDNAVKYTPAGGAVRIGVAVYPMFCAISVSDTGPGISEDEQPRVFQRFYRGLEHQTEEGVGIGLYLVRRIAERQGGYVKVSSRPGAGSTFSLYLPGA